MTTLNGPTLTDCMLQRDGDNPPVALIVHDFKNKNSQSIPGNQGDHLLL